MSATVPSRPEPGAGGRRGGRRVLVAAGLAQLVLLTALAWWPGHGMPFPGLALFAGAFAAYAVAGTFGAGDPPATVTVWGFAILFRVALLPVEPELSDDVFRYLWDGHVQLQGVNPYAHAPADPAVADLRTSWHDRINHPDVPTIYPPLAQAAFFVLALLGESILAAKLLWVGLDLAAGALLARVAHHTGRPPARILLLYLWCPLLVVETAWNAHLEPLGLAPLALLLLFAARKRPAGAGVAAAAAALVKFAPAAALPPLVRRHGMRLGAAFVGACVLLYLPYLGAGAALFEGLSTYARDWRFLVGPFSLLEALLPGRWPPRAAAAAVVIAVVAWTTVRSYDAERALFWIVGAGLLVSPTVHPWYLLWILPFAALRRDGAWLLLGGLVFLGYGGLDAYGDTGVWPQPPWLRLLVWGPPLLWLAIREGRRLRGAVGGARRGGAPGRSPTGDDG